MKTQLGNSPGKKRNTTANPTFKNARLSLENSTSKGRMPESIEDAFV